MGADLVQGLVESVFAWVDGCGFDRVSLVEVEEDLSEYRFVAFLGNQFDWSVLQVNECKLGQQRPVVVLVVAAGQ